MARLFCVVFLVGYGCFINVPKPETGQFACESDKDCVDDYRCFVSMPTQVGRCVPKQCSSNYDCGDNNFCDAQGNCVPNNGGNPCDNCPVEKPFCINNQCEADPCNNDSCPDFKICVVDESTHSGYKCLACNEEGGACPLNKHCVKSTQYGAFCQPNCSDIGKNCVPLDMPGPGWCIELNSAKDDSKVKTCVGCMQGCTGEKYCQLNGEPTNDFDKFEEAVSCQTISTGCTNHSECPEGNCVLLGDGTTTRCGDNCSGSGTICGISKGYFGWCSSVKGYDRTEIDVCVPCDKTCALSEQCLIQILDSYFDHAESRCECDDEKCRIENGSDAFRCNNNGFCTDECDPTTGSHCNSGFVCQDGSCINATTGCNDSNIVSPEVCDDGDEYGGPCNSDCSGPTCAWGLRFDDSSTSGTVTFNRNAAHDLVGDFTIEFWLKFEKIQPKPTYFIGKYNDFGSNYWAVYLDPASAKFKLDYKTGSMQSFYWYNPVATNLRYHVAIVRISGEIKFYLNGVLASEIYPNGNQMTINGSLIIGHPDFFGAHLNKYGMDEIRLWKFAKYTANFLPADNTNLCTHYPETQVNLVGQWLFDFPENNQAYDSGPDQEHGTLDTSGVMFGDVY